MEFFVGILMIFLLFGLRVVGGVYCAQKAAKLNRSAGGWAIFGLFFPIIAMIWISNLKTNITWHGNIHTVKGKRDS